MYAVMSFIRWDDIETSTGVPVSDAEGSIGFLRIFASREAAEKSAKASSPVPAQVQEVRVAVL